MGISDYQRIKTIKLPLLGRNREKDTGAEVKALGWALPGKSVKPISDVFKEFFVSSGQDQIEIMCSLDVLGPKQNEN